MKCEKIELGITDITKAKFLNEHLVANINNNTITILDVIEAKVIKIIRNLPFQYISDILLIDNNLYIVGVGVEFLVYNIETNQFSKIFLSHIGKIEGSAILILNDYFLIADDISESIKIYDKYFNYISVKFLFPNNFKYILHYLLFCEVISFQYFFSRNSVSKFFFSAKIHYFHI